MRPTLAGLALLATATLSAQTAAPWQASFPVDKKNLGIEGTNPYLPLVPGSQWTYKRGREFETITVLKTTRTIDGVECRPVEAREETGGQITGIVVDYYAIDRTTNDVYYMGEDADQYRSGKVVSHQGSWLSGVNGASFGMLLPGSPQLGQRYYQAQAPGIKDRVEIKSIDQKITTTLGTFAHCVAVEESSALNHGVTRKWYARGIGAVKDAEMELVTYARN
jgi:hypothetical protein